MNGDDGKNNIPVDFIVFVDTKITKAYTSRDQLSEQTRSPRWFGLNVLNLGLICPAYRRSDLAREPILAYAIQFVSNNERLNQAFDFVRPSTRKILSRASAAKARLRVW